MEHDPNRRTGRRALVALSSLLAVGGAFAAVAAARGTAVPQNSAPPAISGTAKVGQSLTATNGTWSNTPTSYAYRWQRCANDGTGCGDITGATKQSYTLVTADTSHTVRVVVTAQNADGNAAAPSNPSDVVDSANGPSSTVKPSVSGTEQVGEELTVSNGSWSPTPRSYSYQWQRCDADGSGCRDVAGANGRSYGVRAADVDHRLRALVAAHVTGGVSTVASSASAVVRSNTTTNTVTTTVQGNKAPSLKFLSLRRVGVRVYARFRVCDDALGRLTIVERDAKARALAYTRRFTVNRMLSCGTYSRTWVPAARFRTRGRYVVTLRAIDKSKALSRLATRSLVRR